MKTHHMSAPGAPATCKRVPDAIAKKTTEWRGVTCGWCLKNRPNEPLDAQKLVRALLDNEARYTMPEEERERVVRETRELWEAMKKPIPLQVTNLFAISWIPCGPEFTCPRCKSGMERTTGLMLRSPWAGSVRCTQCDYRDSVTGYLGRSMVQVEPLPEGAVPIYIRELTQVQADEDAKVHAALDAHRPERLRPRPRGEVLTGRVWVPDFPLVVGGTGSPVRRDQWYPACVHVEDEECGCRCHTAPFLHDKACCAPCARCGFRTAVKP